ncbi:MAG: manganese efflux pump [candidate division WOR-3 bacterium]|nr:MAG: manganese efflux pump [candidate division WOR-3 bacterium]
MDIIAIIFIALGLAMDAFAVSVTSGLTIKNLQIKNALKIALFFGAFQAIMPIIGWLAGLSVRDLIAGFDHWVAFGLLCFIGSRMIYESIKPEQNKTPIDPLNIFVLLLLSIATSIDALAVGLSFAFLDISIATPVIIIGIVTFILSYIGVSTGARIGHFFERKIEIVGGLILIGIGVKILIEHVS